MATVDAINVLKSLCITKLEIRNEKNKFTEPVEVRW